MENPEAEVEGVIRLLTQTPPSQQYDAIERYFTADASFVHPFCRTGTFHINQWLCSRNLIHGIYRWYKIMSPRIDLNVNSIALDRSALTLYVSISQRFRIWIVPFYIAPVNLVTVLQLVHDKKSDRYLITSQNDLYQVNEFVRFALFGAWIFVWMWQFVAALLCGVGAVLLWPQTWIEEHWFRDGWIGLARGR